MKKKKKLFRFADSRNFCQPCFGCRLLSQCNYDYKTESLRIYENTLLMKYSYLHSQPNNHDNMIPRKYTIFDPKK